MESSLSEWYPRLRCWREFLEGQLSQGGELTWVGDPAG